MESFCLMHNTSNNKLKIFRRFVFVLFAVSSFLLLLLFGLFHFKKDDIGRAILLRANNIQPGELVFEGISFNPFIRFPDVSVALNNSSYYEKKPVYRETDSIPIIGLKKLYLAFNVIDLVQGNVNVSRFSLDDGHINLVTYANSSINLVRAFGLKQDSLQNNKDDFSDSSFVINLNLENISLNNITVLYTDVRDGSFSNYQVQSLDASLNYSPDTIRCFVNTSIFINEVKIANQFMLNDKQLIINTTLTVNKDFNKIEIEPSRFAFANTRFTVHGSIDLADDGYINLVVKGDDKDFSVLNLFLSKNGMDNIEKGELFFDGTVQGKLFKGIPEIDCSFGINDLQIKLPGTDQRISKINLKGSFYSGEEEDFSEAGLRISKLTATLPMGKLDGRFSIDNFIAPTLDINFFVRGEINGFADIFDLGDIKSLSGILEVKSHFKGKYDIAKKTFDKQSGKTDFKFKAIAVDFPDEINFENVNGELTLVDDTVYFFDISLDYGKSDFLINGTLRNLHFVLLGVEKEIDGQLHIKSAIYDYPDFFKYDQRIAKAFPYRIKNIDLSVSPKTSTTHLLNFIRTPRIVFEINHLNAEVEDFLPLVSINSGLFTLADKDSSLNLVFDDFDIDLLETKITADVVFNSPRVDPDWLTVDANILNLNPKEAFVYWFSDSISDYLDANLNMPANLYMELSDDSVDYKKIDFTTPSLAFTNSVDTFNITGLRIDAKDISYATASSFMETLSLKTGLNFDKISSNHFDVENLEYGIEINGGIYRVVPYKSQFFDTHGVGLYVFKPFEDPPVVELNYRVEQFEIADLLSTFGADTLLKGKMNLNLGIVISGENREEILKSLDGHLLVYGQNLTLNGIDLDKLIERFKRSQRFTFADLGAVLLMGPLGILVTKGTDYTGLLVVKHNTSSEVLELSSNLVLNKGMINLEDFAFTTEKNRMAAKGWIDLNTDSLNITIALLNEHGASIFSQGMTGNIENIEMSKVKVGKLIFAPITNMAKSIGIGKEEVFYDGVVKHPKKEKK